MMNIKKFNNLELEMMEHLVDLLDAAEEGQELSGLVFENEDEFELIYTNNAMGFIKAFPVEVVETLADMDEEFGISEILRGGAHKIAWAVRVEVANKVLQELIEYYEELSGRDVLNETLDTETIEEFRNFIDCLIEAQKYTVKALIDLFSKAE